MKKILTIVFLAFAASVAAQPGRELHGRVVWRGQPEPGAIVELVLKQDPSFRRTFTTDERGEFRFANIPTGTFVLTSTGSPRSSRMIGMHASAEITVIKNTTEIDLELQEPAIHETVTVAAGEAQTIEQVAKTVDVITGQEMRDRADFALIESLRTIPGFRVQQSGGFGRLTTIKTRGLRNSDTAMLLDGVRFRDPTAITGDASPFLADLTLTSVSKVEVLRGSGSSLYGTNAIGGVIDLQTPEPQSGTHGQIGGAFGGLGLRRFRGNISHGLRDGKFGIGAGVSRTVYTKGIDGDDRAENTNFQTRADINPTDKTNISGRIFFSDANVRLNSDPDTLGPLPSTTSIIDAKQNVNFTFDADDPDHFQKTRFFSGQLVGSHALNNRLLIAGYYHGLTTSRTNVNGPLGSGFQPFGETDTGLFDGSIHTANAHVNWSETGKNTLTAGYEFEREKFRNEGTTTTGTANFFTRAGQRSNTFYAQDLLSLDEGRLQIAGGFRVQRFNLGQPRFSLSNAPYTGVVLNDPPTAVTFDGAASYFFARSRTKLRAHVGNGYRVPSLYERFGTFLNTFPTNSFVAFGDPFLKPEKTIAFDGGVEQDLGKEKVRLSATYFCTRLRDIIGFDNAAPKIGTTARPFGGYANQKGGRAQGFETSLKAHPTGSMDIFASYTFTDSVQLTPQVSKSGILKTLGIPDHQFTLVVTQRFDKFWINFDLLASSSYLAPVFSNSTFNTYVYRFQGNRRGDLTAGYTFNLGSDKTTMRIYGTVENLFDQEYYENGFRTPRVNARLGMTFGF